jgi:hypothetical protein
MSLEMEIKGAKNLPLFDGKKENYPAFALVFTSYCGTHGFGDALQKSTAGLPPTNASVSSDDATAKKWALAKKQNAAAIHALSLACQGSTTMISLIWDTVDQDWPQGGAWKAWKLIANAMIEKDLAAKLTIKKELGEVNMKEDDDPNVLVEQLAAIKNKARLAGEIVSLEDQVLTVCPSHHRNIKSYLATILRVK